MTRINANLDPSVLLDAHCMAEYRELPMVMAAARRSLKTQSSQTVMKKIPKDFTLNAGHVTFFYNKMSFLVDRYQRLINELCARGYSLDPNRTLDLSNIPSEFFGDYAMTSADKEVIVERILTRFKQKPTWYTYLGDPIDIDAYSLLIKG